MDEIQCRVRNFITENFLYGQDGQFGNDDSLIERGIIDSTGVLEIVAFLETDFGLEIEDWEIVPANLDSVNRISGFIGQKRHAVVEAR